MTDSSSVYFGLFEDEWNQQCKNLLTRRADEVFAQLDKAVRQTTRVLPTPEMRQTSRYIQGFQSGLNSIPIWSTAVLNGQVVALKKECSYVMDLYNYLIVSYLKELYANRPSQNKDLHIPNIQQFLHAFFISLSRHTVLQSAQYFRLGVLDRDLLIMNAIRDALLTILAPYLDLNDPILETPTPTPDQHRQQQQYYDADGLQTPVVHPWDSISQIGTPRTSVSQVSGVSRLSHASHAPHTSRDPSFVTQGFAEPALTRQTLQEHDQKSTVSRVSKVSHVSRVSGFQEAVHQAISKKPHDVTTSRTTSGPAYDPKTPSVVVAATTQKQTSSSIKIPPKPQKQPQVQTQPHQYKVLPKPQSQSQPQPQKLETKTAVVAPKPKPTTLEDLARQAKAVVAPRQVPSQTKEEIKDPKDPKSSQSQSPKQPQTQSQAQHTPHHAQGVPSLNLGDIEIEVQTLVNQPKSKQTKKTKPQIEEPITLFSDDEGGGTSDVE